MKLDFFFFHIMLISSISASLTDTNMCWLTNAAALYALYIFLKIMNKVDYHLVGGPSGKYLEMIFFKNKENLHKFAYYD